MHKFAGCTFTSEQSVSSRAPFVKGSRSLSSSDRSEGRDGIRGRETGTRAVEHFARRKWHALNPMRRVSIPTERPNPNAISAEGDCSGRDPGCTLETDQDGSSLGQSFRGVFLGRRIRLRVWSHEWMIAHLYDEHRLCSHLSVRSLLQQLCYASWENPSAESLTTSSPVCFLRMVPARTSLDLISLPAQEAVAFIPLTSQRGQTSSSFVSKGG